MADSSYTVLGTTMFPTDSSDTDRIYTLEDLSRELLIKQLPILIFYVILLVVGVVGNVVVMYVYKYKFKRSSARVYILCLAFTDFFTCLVGLPYHILDIIWFYTYNHPSICKALSFLISTWVFSSVFVLLVVGLDRYLKVCHPLKKQVIDFGNKKACIIAVAIAVVFSLPNIVIYGERTESTQFEYLNSTACYVSDDYVGSELGIAYYGVYTLTFLLAVTYLVVIYGFIARKIYLHDKMQLEIKVKKQKRMCCSCLSPDKENKGDDLEEDGEDEEDEDDEDDADCLNENDTYYASDVGDTIVMSGYTHADDIEPNEESRFLSEKEINQENEDEVIETDETAFKDNKLESDQNNKDDNETESEQISKCENNEKKNELQISESKDNDAESDQISENKNERMINDLQRSESSDDQKEKQVEHLKSSESHEQTVGETSQQGQVQRSPNGDHNKPVSVKRQISKDNNKQTKIRSERTKKMAIKAAPSSGMVKHGRKAEKNTRKITMMMMTITIVFIVSYLPYILISILTAIDEEYWEDMTYLEMLINDFFLRLYLINYVANPIIYSFWDKRFRKECWVLCRKLLPCGRRKEARYNSTFVVSKNTEHTMK